MLSKLAQKEKPKTIGPPNTPKRGREEDRNQQQTESPAKRECQRQTQAQNLAPEPNSGCREQAPKGYAGVTDKKKPKASKNNQQKQKIKTSKGREPAQPSILKFFETNTKSRKSVELKEISQHSNPTSKTNCKNNISSTTPYIERESLSNKGIGGGHSNYTYIGDNKTNSNNLGRDRMTEETTDDARNPGASTVNPKP